MESWEYQLDQMLKNPPEGPESKLRCEVCGAEIYPDERYYELDGLVNCSDCAHDWMGQQAKYATADQCFGEDE